MADGVLMQPECDNFVLVEFQSGVKWLCLYSIHDVCIYQGGETYLKLHTVSASELRISAANGLFCKGMMLCMIS